MDAILTQNETFPEQKTEAWLGYRKLHFSSTDAKKIMSDNPKEVNEVVLNKCGKPRTFFGSTATRHGEKYEAEALQKFAELYEVKPILLNIVEHATDPRFIFSPDAILPSGTICEIKCPYSRKIDGKISKQYWCQVQLGMEIMHSRGFGTKEEPLFAYFIEYKPKGHGYCAEEILSVNIIERDPTFFPTLLEKANKVWDEIETIRADGEIDFNGFIGF